MAQYKVKKDLTENKMLKALKPTKEDLTKVKNFFIGFGWFFIIFFKSIGFLFALLFLFFFNTIKKKVDKEVKK